ncbi:hypothetical protein [Acinetobacter sp. ANC 3882]|uniref:hypothetical protein n=1 Tax=Acinetobacter sp. ANC 3882 TaxID=2923423 RepID=UPI001F4B11F3|nr:hypothetical protein [Acinetobacter sp. ANC 3882]MCH7315768.1 hypothetical protein [Acinetobacter sp. ANC 3882]
MKEINMIYSVFFSVFSRLGLLVLTFIAVKYLPTIEYGEFSYFLNILNTFILIATAGCGVSTNIAFSKNYKSNESYCYNVLGFNVLVILILSFFLWLFFLLFYFFVESSISITLIAILSFLLFVFSNINLLIESVYMGIGDFKQLALNSILILILTVSLSYFMISNYYIWGALISYFGYKFISFFLNMAKIRISCKKIKYNLNSVEGIVNFKEIGLPSLMSSLMVAPVISLSITIALMFTSYKEMAYFNWVYQIYLVAIFIPSTLGGFFLHKLSNSISTINQTVKKLVLLNFFFSIAVVFILFFLKKYILTYAGEDFIIHASSVYNFMLLAVVFYSLNSVFSSVWPSFKKAWVGFFLNFIWAFSILIVTFLGSKHWGVDALAIAFFSSYLILFIVQFILYYFLKESLNKGLV